ncbi:MAG: hypothetical protein JJT99_08500 [Rhodobacteraceae bacterium]|nr:hypothetical protein [Paracoccaceae bacterium]
MPSACKDQTHKLKPKKTKKIKRTISNMRRKAPPLPAEWHKGSGAKKGISSQEATPPTNRRIASAHKGRRQFFIPHHPNAPIRPKKPKKQNKVMEGSRTAHAVRAPAWPRGLWQALKKG